MTRQRRSASEQHPGAGDTPTTALRLLSSAEVARILGVTTSTLCRLRQEGKGPRCIWITDHTPRYREDEVLAYIESRGS